MKACCMACKKMSEDTMVSEEYRPLGPTEVTTNILVAGRFCPYCKETGRVLYKVLQATPKYVCFGCNLKQKQYTNKWLLINTCSFCGHDATLCYRIMS